MTTSKREIDWGDTAPAPIKAGKPAVAEREVDWGDQEPQQQSNAETHRADIQSQHPILYKIAEMVAKHPDLQKFVNKAGEDVNEHINKPIERSGLPIVAEHALTLPRTIAELMTGREHHAPTENINPDVAQAEKRIGQTLSAATGGPMVKNIPGMFGPSTAKKLQEALMESGENEQTLREQQAKASHEFGSNKPERLDLMTQDKTKALQEAMQRMQEQFGGRTGPHQPSEMISENANQALANARQGVQQYGGQGQNFPKRISDEFMTQLRGEENPETGLRQNGFEQAIGNRYTVLSHKMRTDPNPVEITETPNLSELAIKVKKQLPELADEYQQQITKKWADELTTNKKVNGADFLESYRGFRQELRKLNDKYWGASIAEQRALRPEQKQLKDTIRIMRDTMDKQLGGHYLAELQNIDKQYATYVAPLAKNSIYRLLKKGETPENPLQKISLNQKGNKTLRLILDENPELQRLLFGEQFAAKPEKLLQPNEVVDELTTKNPQIHAIRQKLWEAEQNLEPKLQQAAEQKEFEALSHNIPKLKEEIKLAEQLSEDIRKSLKAKNLSKEEVNKLEAKLTKISNRRKGLAKLLGLSSYLKILKPWG
jgi:hypothetical protein